VFTPEGASADNSNSDHQVLAFFLPARGLT